MPPEAANESGHPEPPVPFDRTLDSVLGFQTEQVDEGLLRGSFEVADHHRQPMGIVHGGVYAALAEGLCSQWTFHAVYPDGKYAVGLSNQTSFLRPVNEGVVTAEARCKHRGRTTWVWEVEFTDAERRTCALSRVTLAVREIPAAQAGGPD